MNDYEAVFVYGNNKIHQMSIQAYSLPEAWAFANHAAATEFGVGAPWEVVAIYNLEHCSAVAATLDL